MGLLLDMESNTDRLNHGLHNEAACNYLYNSRKFSDWVITTAFYSAIHLVQHKIFPFSITYQDTELHFDTFAKYSEFYKKSNKNDNDHKIMLNLVIGILPTIRPDYRFLKDAAYNARYQDYQVSLKIVEKAKVCLDKIKDSCSK